MEHILICKHDLEKRKKFRNKQQSNKVENMKQEIYVSPAVMTLELYCEGVICGSNELLEENEGEW